MDYEQFLNSAKDLNDFDDILNNDPKKLGIKEGDICLIETVTGERLLKKLQQLQKENYILNDDTGSTTINKKDIKSIAPINALYFKV